MSSTLTDTECKIYKIPPDQISYYSEKDKAYLTRDPRLHSFYSLPPQLDSFKEAIKIREQFPVDRTLLIDSITLSYHGMQLSDKQAYHLDLLKESNTYTITTAHQPNLFTGPLYFVYKICSAIRLTLELNKAYPEHNFIPIFVSGGEDHDFQEINHCYLYGNKIEWYQDKGGPVGRLALDNFDEVLEVFIQKIGNQKFTGKIRQMLENALSGSLLYKDFQFKLIHSLFKEYGLLVIDMDQKPLKAAFIPMLKEEILSRISRKIILETQKRLDKLGFKSQAFPRDINLFYLQTNRRDRIEYQDGKYVVLDTSISFTQEEIITELHQFPEKFSPNVVMRPLYQEALIPNLAYIGGGGEIAYWLERKDQFKHFGIPFPILIRRNSAMIINHTHQLLLEKLHITPGETLQDTDALIVQFLQNETEFDIFLDNEKNQIDYAFESIGNKAGQIDPTLEKWIQAEKVKQLKLVDQMESRIRRTVKQQQEIRVNQIKKIKDKLFPNNGLQERFDNFFQYFAADGPELIDQFIQWFDPLDPGFCIIIQNKHP
ncbi:MAG TPA: bacillithiol biosynthesis cysteine-adding enzyme BshC [Saprospiraceae bacterium]|nr:bacillithiol biosynthesis cysteine-adding enzyme BshC [Saprospiraceae bacterium]